jgi:tetratricopeptide (TPR) repeat protein
MSKRDQKRSKRKSARKEKLRKQKAGQHKRDVSSQAVTNISVTRENLGEAMTAAVQLHHAAQHKDAAQLYRQVLAVKPDHPDALSSLAMIEYHAQHYDEAIDLLLQAINIVEDNAGYYMNLGAVFDSKGDLEASAKSYRQAIEIEPTYPDPYYNLGDLLLRQSQPEDAISVFDECMSAIGREFHALAYKAHSLDDVGRHDEARYLLNFGEFVKTYQFDPPRGYDSIEAFNEALARHIKTHPTLEGNVMSTEHGKHTAELLREPVGPMGVMEHRIHEAIHWYIDHLPDDPGHPAVEWIPKTWKLTSWGVVMFDKGHERAHIHPNGWLSGVFYVNLPDVINDSTKEHEGWLEFGRPTADLHVKSPLTLMHYQPAYGEMFLFPSYFYHGTIPFRSKQRRICVAFDVEPLSYR